MNAVNSISTSNPMTVISITRFNTNNYAIIGKMMINDVFECYTLEHPILHIPTGDYPVTLEYSNRFQMITPHLQNVPNRTMIEIHPGNSERDTEGCILVGQTYDDMNVLQSRNAFESLMPKLKEPIQIEIA